jgi:hypothetical protein
MSAEALAMGTLIFTGIQTIFVAAAAMIAIVNLRKFRDARGVDFIINAESTIDPLRHGLSSADASVIRSVYKGYMLEDLTEDDCRAFPFMQSVYSHVSRMYFILCNDRLDLGLHSSEREQLVESWTRYLVLFKDHPAMKKMHANAIKNKDFNKPFLDLAARLMSDH